MTNEEALALTAGARVWRTFGGGRYGPGRVKVGVVVRVSHPPGWRSVCVWAHFEGNKNPGSYGSHTLNGGEPPTESNP